MGQSSLQHRPLSLLRWRVPLGSRVRGASWLVGLSQLDRPALLALFVLPMLFTACVVLPPETPPGEPHPLVLNILTNKLDPREIEALVIDRTNPAHIFDVTNAVESSDGRSSGFDYRWYYDFDADLNLPLTASSYGQCTGHEQCILGFCAGLYSEGIDHTLMLVVSTGDLKANTKDPLDFKEGVAFDWVAWRLKLINDCPP